jgi:hypothetical protein
MNPESRALKGAAVLVVSTSLFPTQVSASGSALIENSVVAQDPAFAGISVPAEDAITIWS